MPEIPRHSPGPHKSDPRHGDGQHGFFFLVNPPGTGRDPFPDSSLPALSTDGFRGDWTGGVLIYEAEIPLEKYRFGQARKRVNSG